MDFDELTLYCIYQETCKVLLLQGVPLQELNNYDNFEGVLSREQFKVIMNSKQNRKNKRYRTKKKILELFDLSTHGRNGKIVFGTITLNDYYLGLKENTYIRKIHKWLKKHFTYSILNKDFGKKTEREHYHFIGLTYEEIESKNVKSKKGYEIYELVNKDYEMGFEPDLCLLDFEKSDLKQTINYLLKLNNHSNKKGTKSRVRVIKNPIVDVLFEKRKNM